SQHADGRAAVGRARTRHHAGALSAYAGRGHRALRGPALGGHRPQAGRRRSGGLIQTRRRPVTIRTSTIRAGVCAALAGLLMATPAAAQTSRVLSLDEALALAGATSEDVAIAEAAVARAEGEQLPAR